MLFGERLKELMLEKDITAVSLSDAINVDPSVIRRWYNHNMDVNLSTLLLLADYFSCSLEFVSGRIEIDEESTFKLAGNFYENLASILKQKKITEYRISTDKIFSRNMFFQWKNGSQPRLSSLIKIADYLDVTLDYLVGRE